MRDKLIIPCGRCGKPFQVSKSRSQFCSMACRDGSLVGQRFGRLTVIALDRSEGGVRYWECRCDCGETITAKTHNLNRGSVRSCGCLVADTNAATKTIHGAYGSKEYRSWISMKKRCNYPKHRFYHRYGGRGIRVCDEWQESFAAFLADVGPAPSPKHSIDRIDNDGNYEPGNVRWATAAEQGRNRAQCHRR